MYAEFKNQLTNKDIFIGIFAYINRKLWFLFLLVTMGCVVFFYFILNEHNVVKICFFIILSIILSNVVFFLMLKKNFSSTKVATYILNDQNLKIINSEGKESVFTYDQIGMAELKQLFVLFLNKNTFSLVSKKHMSKEQIAVLRQLIRSNGITKK